MEDNERDRIEALATQFEGRGNRNSHGGGKRGGRGGRDRGGRGGALGGTRDSQVSRALSRLLRHQAENAGIKLDKEGYAPLDRVLQWNQIRSLAPTVPEIQELVRSSDKQRFSLKPNPATNPALDEAATDPAHWLIRANQGHSIKLESEGLLRPILLEADTSSAPLTAPGDVVIEADSKNDGAAPVTTSPAALPIPPNVVHGTYLCFWPDIEAAGGLKPMGRNHVHFSTGLPPAWAKKIVSGQAGTDHNGGLDGDSSSASAPDVISGMRRDAELLIYVDVAQSIREAGIKWWMSENGVVLTEGDETGLVPTRFFREVVGRKEAVGVLWKNGEKVADIPKDVKGIVPRGKERRQRLTDQTSRGGRGRGKGRAKS